MSSAVSWAAPLVAIGWVLVGVSAADSVKLANGLTYAPVTVTGVADATVEFRLDSGRVIQKALAEVAVIALDNDPDFTQGEALLAQGKHAEAARAYSRAADAATGWRRTLIGYRLLAVEDKAGRIGKAVEQWLGIVDATNASEGALRLRPRTLAPAGSEENDRAIFLLAARLTKTTDSKLGKEIRLALVDLYERQGKLDEAQKIAAQLSAATPQGNGGVDTQPVRPTRIPPSAGAALLRQGELALKAGEHARVIDLINPALKSFSVADLPTALYLLGGAQLGQARAEKDPKAARPLLMDAGLNLMRVAVNFPNSAEAGEALLLAGEVNERIGSKAGALAAYQTVARRSAEPGLAARAKAAIERIAAQRQP